MEIAALDLKGFRAVISTREKGPPALYPTFRLRETFLP